MKNKFTLIELVSVILILSILLSIILLKVSDVKKQGVFSMVSSNTSVLQSAVDEYYLKEEKYPIKNGLTISSPQIVNVKELVEKGYLKKDLDLTKISSQLYWVDIFGRVWGATENPPNNVSVLEGVDNKSLSFKINNDNVAAYNIYEVSGNDLNRLSYKDIEIKKPNKSSILASDKTQYKLVYSGEFNKDSEKAITFTGKNKNSIYLVSIVDSYGLESVPVGLFNNEYFSPLINFIGTREYEIEGSKLMYWIDFIAFEKKPAGTNISYLFKTKGEDGEYGEWTEDFFSLDPSKGIIVKISMTSEDHKIKPSLYDLHVLYHFGNIQSSTFPNPYLVPPASFEPISPLGGITSASSGGFGGSDEGSDNGDTTGSGSNGEGSGGSGNEGDDSGSGGSGSEGTGSGSTGITNTCPSGFTQSTFKSEGTTIDGSSQGLISFLFDLPEGSMLEQLIDLKIIGGVVNGVTIQYAEKGSNSGYVTIDSLFEVPSNSCVNVIYKATNSGGGISLVNKPIIKISEKTKYKKVDEDSNNFIPVEDEKDEDKEIEWTTVDEIKFTGNSQTNEAVKWIGFEKEEYTPENTRIQYWFTGLNGSSWTEPTQTLSELPASETAVVVAKLQVRTSELENPNQEEPYITKMKLVYGGGEVVYNENNRDITFYSTGEKPVNERNMFDDDIDTESVVSLTAGTNITFDWELRSGYNPNLTGKALKIRARTAITSSRPDVNTIRLLDQNGNYLSFYYRIDSDSKYTYGNAIPIDNGVKDYYIVLPEGAINVAIYPSTATAGRLSINDIKFQNPNVMPSELTDFKINAGFTNVSMSWSKPNDVASVDIYRGNTYIGTSTGTSFSDPQTLMSNTTYTYSFVVSDVNFNAFKQTSDKFIVKTLDMDITFNSTGAKPANPNNMFDNDINTEGVVSLTSGTNITFDWKLRSGYTPDLTGKALKIRARTATTSSRPDVNTIRVLDQNGNFLSFYYRIDSDTKYAFGNAIPIDNGVKDYYIVLPEKAVKFAIYPNGEKSGRLSIQDIKFNNLNSKPIEIENLIANKNSNKATLSWKQSNVVSTDIFRNGSYIGSTTGNTFTDSVTHVAGSSRTYTVVSKDAYHNVVTKSIVVNF